MKGVEDALRRARESPRGGHRVGHNLVEIVVLVIVGRFAAVIHKVVRFVRIEIYVTVAVDEIEWCIIGA